MPISTTSHHHRRMTGALWRLAPRICKPPPRLVGDCGCESLVVSPFQKSGSGNGEKMAGEDGGGSDQTWGCCAGASHSCGAPARGEVEPATSTMTQGRRSGGRAQSAASCSLKVHALRLSYPLRLILVTVGFRLGTFRSREIARARGRAPEGSYGLSSPAEEEGLIILLHLQLQQG